MKNKTILLIVIVSLLFTNDLIAQTVPPPLKNVKIQARVVLDENGIYHYYHTVTNPAENKIGIGDVKIDITVPQYSSPSEDVWAEGYATPDSYSPANAERRGLRYIPIAWNNTSLWSGGIGLEDGRWSILGRAAVMSWGAEYNFQTKYQYLLNPGATSEELEIISYGLPGIRKVGFKPDWLTLKLPAEYLSSEKDSLEEIIKKERKIELLGCLSTTVGPTGIPAYTRLQFNQMLQEYVTESVNLGWLKDATLTQQLNNYLTQSAAAISENRLLDAQNIINQFMNAVQTSSLSQRTNEAYALLYFNAKYLFKKLQ